jgi:hypothetical protein
MGYLRFKLNLFAVGKLYNENVKRRYGEKKKLSFRRKPESIPIPISSPLAGED